MKQHLLRGYERLATGSEVAASSLHGFSPQHDGRNLQSTYTKARHETLVVRPDLEVVGNRYCTENW